MELEKEIDERQQAEEALKERFDRWKRWWRNVTKLFLENSYLMTCSCLL
jgi:hypothetical protein